MKNSIRKWLALTISASAGIAIGMLLSAKKECGICGKKQKAGHE